ncbi:PLASMODESMATA CALLOSE-BINDING PROTEIN 3-like [Heracleum sosnowskyi]|uniref:PLASMODESMATA CALLOSE-BINDING PROTEIN 3-like n=1 Tax=Heracleum sosnowskyi TaxID=360622 RepID=A0AAD8MQQ4_9APIA|nr:PLASMODESMATA CALLOSE-BINDING PROTEIN 3-like [Heracleum sosnowskyi]
MAAPLHFLVQILMTIQLARAATMTGSWCVARSDASDDALQLALDYACASGADCIPIQPSGLCFLPNTIQAHASYAFNSFFQRKSMVPGSCDFSASATVAKTDPSYGSCVYPSSSSTAGGTIPPGTDATTPTAIPLVSAPPPPLGTSPTFGTTGLNPGAPLPDAPPSAALAESSVTRMLFHLSFSLIVLFVF